MWYNVPLNSYRWDGKYKAMNKDVAIRQIRRLLVQAASRNVAGCEGERLVPHAVDWDDLIHEVIATVEAIDRTEPEQIRP